MLSSNSSSAHTLVVQFSEYYAQIHGRIVFPLTIFGILTSIVTIIVLNRKNFQTPTNLILQYVAFFDTIVLVSYNIYSLYFYILHSPNPFVGQSRFWPRFAVFHSNVGLTAHSIALWLTCLLAIIRYMIISKPKQTNVNSTYVTFLIVFVCFVICVLMIPNYLIWSVVPKPAHEYLPHLYSINSSETVYWISTTTGKKLEKVSFAIMAAFFKILPVLILIIFSVLLIASIRRARQLRERLRRRYSSVSSSSFTRELRTTTMLVFITLCTVIVELPQGLLFIASGIDERFFLLYSQLGDFWDITSIGSSFITFIMYCSMSQQFRAEMYALILPTYCINKCNLKANNNQSSSNRLSGKKRTTITHSAVIVRTASSLPEDL